MLSVFAAHAHASRPALNAPGQAGGLASYLGNIPVALSDVDHFVLRHLMANVKTRACRGT